MKLFLIIIIGAIAYTGCRPAREINRVIAVKDTAVVVNKSSIDSLNQIKSTLQAFKNNHIDFKTFSAKIKADVETSKEKLPDLSAIVRIQKDKAIWMSVSATILNIEVYRIFITPDSVILLNKKDKEVQYRSLDYLQEVANLPFDFKTIQDLLIGNPIFYNDSIQAYRKVENFVLITSRGEFFKHLLTLTPDTKLLVNSKLDDIDIRRNRTANISYSEYENHGGFNFPTNREIVISEKSKIDMKLKYRQIEFNKELSMTFNIPKNYTVK